MKLIRLGKSKKGDLREFKGTFKVINRKRDDAKHSFNARPGSKGIDARKADFGGIETGVGESELLTHIKGIEKLWDDYVKEVTEMIKKDPESAKFSPVDRAREAKELLAWVNKMLASHIK